MGVLLRFRNSRESDREMSSAADVCVTQAQGLAGLGAEMPSKLLMFVLLRSKD